MSTVDVTSEAMEAAARALSGKGPIQMVNLLRYREQADYGDRTEFSPCSGRQAYYERYIAAFAKVEGAERTVIVWLGHAQATLIAPDEEVWDDIAIVEYPSFDVLQGIVDSPEYRTKAAPHRQAALEDWRFIATTKAELPG